MIFLTSFEIFVCLSFLASFVSDQERRGEI